MIVGDLSRMTCRKTSFVTSRPVLPQSCPVRTGLALNYERRRLILRLVLYILTTNRSVSEQCGKAQSGRMYVTVTYTSAAKIGTNRATLHPCTIRSDLGLRL